MKVKTCNRKCDQGSLARADRTICRSSISHWQFNEIAGKIRKLVKFATTGLKVRNMLMKVKYN